MPPESTPRDLGRDEAARGALQFTVHPLPQVGLESASDRSGVDDSARRRSGRAKMLLVLAISAAPVIASYFMYFVVQPKGGASHAELITPTTSWPAGLEVKGVDGAAVPGDRWRRQWSLVAFGRGVCDAACEKRLHTQRQLREMLGRERDRVDKVFVVLDDAPLDPKLAAALAAQPPVQVLRASGEGVARWLGKPLDEIEARLHVVDPMGEWMMRSPREIDPAKFKRDLERLLRASSSWDRPGR